MKTEIVSFYADIDNRTYYSDHALRLKENCDRLNIPHDIRELKSKGEYRLNCLAKPKFILDMMLEKRKPFVWMDVDSIIHQELSAYDDLAENFDIGFAYQAVPPIQSLNFPKASPIYLNFNKITLEFVKIWLDGCEENSKNKEQKVFDHEILMYQVLPKYLSKLRIYGFPINYAIWPGTEIPENMTPMITMGIADGISKEKSLREMGLNENTVKFNLVGNK